MKLKNIKVGQKFKTFSNVEMIKIPISNYEKKTHQNYPNKVQRTDTKEIFYLENNFFIKDL